MAIKHSHCGFCGRRFGEGLGWPRRCSGCGQQSYINPTPVAVALVPVGGGLLVIRRGIEPHRGKLALPGGYVEWGESWQQACAREVYEEAGLVLSPDGFRERRIISISPGLLLIFGESRPWPHPTLPPFAITDETTERLVLREPTELAFPPHTQLCRDWFEANPLPPR